MVFAEDHEKEITMDDMSTKSEKIVEAAGVKECADGKRPKVGLWIAGEKWNITQQRSMEIGDHEVSFTFAQGLKSQKKGLFIVKTKSQVVMAMYDEEKE